MSKLKAFEDDNLSVSQLMEFVENIVGYQHFLLISKCFPKASTLRSLKAEIVW